VVSDESGLLSLDDEAWFAAGAGQVSPHLSESAFSNLYLYRSVHHYERHDQPLPHVCGLTYDGVRCVLPLFDVGQASTSSLAEILRGADCLFPMTDAQAQRWQDRFRATALDDDSDYIFEGRRMAGLIGAKERRRQADHFQADQQPQFRDIVEGDDAALRTILSGWLQDVGRRRDATDTDICAEAIVLRARLGLFGLVVETRAGEPAGFLLASALSPDMAAIHFAKGRRQFEGVFPAMFRAFARRWPDFRWINFEQDLGNPGFRQSKRAYSPAKLLRKNRLFLEGKETA
jgi:hypothetical protein